MLPPPHPTPKKLGDVGMKLCNKIPSNIKEPEKNKFFKRELRFFLLQHIFYSVEEYVMLQVVNISLLVTEDCDVLSCIILYIVGVNLFM
jgi:hypothetical protein